MVGRVLLTHDADSECVVGAIYERQLEPCTSGLAELVACTRVCCVHCARSAFLHPPDDAACIFSLIRKAR